MKFNIIDDIVPKKATDNMSYNHLNRLLDLAEQTIRKKLGNPNINTEAIFTFRNGKTATVKQFAEKPHFELIFENQTIFRDNQQRIVAYDLLVLGYVDTPTAKAMGFLLLRPLHCRKDFSFT